MWAEILCAGHVQVMNVPGPQNDAFHRLGLVFPILTFLPLAHRQQKRLLVEAMYNCHPLTREKSKENNSFSHAGFLSLKQNFFYREKIHHTTAFSTSPML
ncbi:hypothetical protein L1887_29834 [Cichorium endivia]|nr:hypothetical protein L1887_29834 [Cichorium endivia]